MCFFKFALTFLFQLQIKGMAVFFVYPIGGLVMIIATEETPEAMFVAEIPAAPAAVDVMQMQIVLAASDEAEFARLENGRIDFCFFLGFFHGVCLPSLTSKIDELLDAVITCQPDKAGKVTICK